MTRSVILSESVQDKLREGSDIEILRRYAPQDDKREGASALIFIDIQ